MIRAPLSADEVRRLAPSVDFKKSAILTKWEATRWQVAGLVDLGTSWNRAPSNSNIIISSPHVFSFKWIDPGEYECIKASFS